MAYTKAQKSNRKSTEIAGARNNITNLNEWQRKGCLNMQHSQSKNCNLISLKNTNTQPIKIKANLYLYDTKSIDFYIGELSQAKLHE
jgi:hypothetical protein